MRTLWNVTIGAVLALGLTMPSAQASNPDLTVYRFRSLVDGRPATMVKDQYPVTFRAFVKNLGPGTTGDMFGTYSNTRRLYVASEACIVPDSESGDFNNVSPDTPS